MIKSLCSDELYSKIDRILFDNIMTMPLYNKIKWIHLRDAVDCGTITPLEAYDCISLGYVAEHLTVRKSRYSHLL